MTNITATNSHAITPLVGAAETLVGTLTGKPLSDNVLKITGGATSLMDGLFPALAGKLSFDLNGVLEGATEALTGINTAIAAAKTAPVQTAPAIKGGA